MWKTILCTAGPGSITVWIGITRHAMFWIGWGILVICFGVVAALKRIEVV